MPKNFSLDNNASLCILRLSAIGDVCHAASMVTRIRAHRPDIKITWVIGKIEYQLMQGMEGVEFIVFDKKAGSKGVKSVANAVAGRKFDALCVMQVALRANWLSRQISADIRLGFDKAHSKEGHSLFINRRIAPLNQPHVLEGFHAFADALGIPHMNALRWDITLPAKDTAFAQQLSEEHGSFVVISPAASKLERSWLPERYAHVADHCAQLGYKVVICGGPGPIDTDLDQKIASLCHIKPLSLVGKTSLKQMLAVLKNAALVISPDTGPAHMATAMQTPVIGLYAHSNPRRTGPYLSLNNVVSTYDNNMLLQNNKPWQHVKWGTRAKGDNLMADITVEQVITKVDSIIGQIVV